MANKNREIVIKMDEDILQGIIEGVKDEPRQIVRNFQATIADAIKNGILIPKEHGKIVDIDKLSEEMKATRTYDIPFALERIKPIIEANKTKSKDNINERDDDWER